MKFLKSQFIDKIWEKVIGPQSHFHNNIAILSHQSEFHDKIAVILIFSKSQNILCQLGHQYAPIFPRLMLP